MSNTIALIAHDLKKAEMVVLVKQYEVILSRYQAIATGNTGNKIQEQTNLKVDCLLPGAMGGDMQIAAQVAIGEVAAVIFLLDSLGAQPQEPDIQTFLRICEVHDVPLATNLVTAKIVINSLSNKRIAHLIFNPISGQGNPDQDLALIKRLLKPQINLNVILTEPDIEPGEQAKEAIKSGTDLVIASGGDGTISAVAAAVMETDIPLGVIPRGTANAFSVALGIPTNINAACETILAGTTRVVDVARCNNIPMILLAGIGFEAEIVAKADREFKNQFGVFAYLLAGAQQFAAQETFEAQVEIDGQISNFQSAAMTVANAAPPTSILAQGWGETVEDDGLLDVTIGIRESQEFNLASRLQAVNALASLFTSALIKQPINREDIICLRVPQIKISANPPQKVVVDGEIIGTTPVEIRCIPQGLTVFAPLSQN
ncbi:methylglyoxal synthase [Xenococcus sp. PCC 7305]|uniref:methylglyoxal synthase n=1 Tax=Xenococcus sp. PCC 7305 TaxID=102125 RepID=UPI0002ACB92D|nr:methylglyoxal synthase [Xenococcus sp. PCC 7305]ELS01594.1 methylglyoxal synthase [Xenococcus sp. PCC 7305]